MFNGILHFLSKVNMKLHQYSFVQTIDYFFSHFLIEFKNIPENSHEFGAKIAILKYLDSVLRSRKPRGYISTIRRWIEKEYNDANLIVESSNIENRKKSLSDNCIWICWWQGEENMPDIVRACYCRIKKMMSKSYDVILLTKDNYSEYVDLAAIVIKKYENGMMCLAHFSDVLRFKLLGIYGGVWIDATLWLCKDVSSIIKNTEFYSPHLREMPDEASDGKWCTFFLAGTPNFCFFKDVYSYLVYYWEKHDLAVDYVLLDYTMYYIYQKNSDYREVIDSVEMCDQDVWALAYKFYDEFDEDKYSELIGKNDIYKFTYKFKYPKQTRDGHDTFYGKIIESIHNPDSIA